MLINLHIVNLALIDELDIDFNEGLNILTGETGAGKSIIIGSIGIGLGGKYDTSFLRNPDKEGQVELLFSVNECTEKLLAMEEIEVSDGELLISRRLVNGRTVNRINDKTVTVAKLKTVAGILIGLHAQHEQRTLLKVSHHLDMVDNFSEKIKGLKENVAELYRNYKTLSDKVQSMQMDETERIKKADYIRYEINDIESARLKPGEDTELEDIYRKASAAQDIAEITSEVGLLTGYDKDISAGNLVSRAAREISGLMKLDPSAEELINTLSDIDGLLSDFSRQLADYASDTQFEPEVLAETENRLNLINTLKSRYGDSIEAVLESLDSLKVELEELESYDETVERLKKEMSQAETMLSDKCIVLTKERKKSAKQLTAVVAEAMRELNFNDVRFDMNFEETEPGMNGADKAEFMISTNVGEKMRPLADTASGGELSRIMLAIKSVVSEADDTPTLIFDEIDVGISGITAQKVGNMMKRLGETRQVIAITHLPQIAAKADHAYVIQKEVIDNKTLTSIKPLDEEGRVMELARLLGGENITETIIASAREMIK